MIRADDRKGPGSGPRRILILTVAGLGDFVAGTPALRAIRERYPQACIWLLTIPEVGPLAGRCPYVDAVRTLNLRRSRSALAWVLGPGRREMWPLIAELRAMRFDIGVNLYAVGTRAGGLRMAAFLRAIGPRRIVGRSSRGRGIASDASSHAQVHEVEAQLAVARLLGAMPTEAQPELWVTPEDRAGCLSLLQGHGISAADSLACLQVGSAQTEKRWPAERFATVGCRLSAAGARVLLIGSQSERDLCASVARAVPRAVSLAGETSLPVLAALLQHAALLVTNDSGPMHMAAALAVPLVATFGPGTPDRFGPRGRGVRLVFAGTQRPDGSAWWDEVGAEVVAEAALRLFREASAKAVPQGETT